MNKLTYNSLYKLEEKDIEKKLWDVFWSYSNELDISTNEIKKEELVTYANNLIPEFAEYIKKFELKFYYPVVHLLLTSLHVRKNFLATLEINDIMEQAGADNDAKLELLVVHLQKKGIVW